MKSLEEIKDAIKRITVEENRPLKGNKGPLKQVLEGLLDIVNGLNEETSGKQDTLVSGENIKTVNGQSILGSGDLIPNGMVETTWAELKELRDNAQLVPGTMYRITDYMTTTAQEDTRSAGHQFDVIVTALTESVLSEDAKAIQHEFEWPETVIGVDTWPSYGTMYYSGIIEKDGVSYICYRANNEHNDIGLIDPNNIILDVYNEGEDNPYIFQFTLATNAQGNLIDGLEFLTNQDLREFSYFSNSNLAAWKLKYCLDNDEDRFAWAKNLYLSPVSHNKCIQVLDGNDKYIYVRQSQLDNENGLAWCYGDNTDNGCSIEQYSKYERELLMSDDIIYTPSENVYIGQILDMSGDPVTIVDFSEQGKGVIYQMIDEHNNDVPYDFKNIQYYKDINSNGGLVDWGSLVLGDDYDGEYYFYTFSWFNENASIEDISTVTKLDENDELSTAQNNTILKYYTGNKIFLNEIIFVSSFKYDGEYCCHFPDNNVFREQCASNIFGDDTKENIFDCYFYNNYVGTNFRGNHTFGTIVSIHVDDATDVSGNIIYMSEGATIFKEFIDAFGNNS